MRAYLETCIQTFYKKIYKFKLNNNLLLSLVLAERQGFEPWVPLTVHTLSKRAL